jgi:methionine-rich copper-binding protein CopC
MNASTSLIDKTSSDSDFQTAPHAAPTRSLPTGDYRVDWHAGTSDTSNRTGHFSFTLKIARLHTKATHKNQRQKY